MELERRRRQQQGDDIDIDAAVELARRSDVVIVIVGDDPFESCDLPTLRLPIVAQNARYLLYEIPE